MDWSHYLYLLGVAAGALALVAALVRRPPTTRREERLALLAVLMLAALAIYGRFLFGSLRWAYLDVGNDTTVQYVPFYLNLLDNIRAGDLGLWNFEFGLGTTLVSCQSWVLDPFNLVLVPLGLALGNAWLGQILVLIQVLKVVATGLLVDELLTHFCREPLARLLGACLFSLGGFLMLWGQHYWLGTAVVLYAALLLALETQLAHPGTGPALALSLVVALTLIWSVYVGFMCLLGAFFHALLRWVLVCGRRRGEGREPAWIATLLGLAAPVLAGCLVAGITLVPYARYLLGETARTSSGAAGADTGTSLASRLLTSATSFVPLRWLPMLCSRLLGNALVSAGEPLPDGLVPATELFPYVNVFEIVSLGCSGAALVLLLQFSDWACREADRRTRTLLAVTGLLVVAYCVNNLLPSLFNALAAPKYRSSFVVALPLCIACAVAWERRVLAGRLNRPFLVLGTLLTLGTLAWSLRHTVNGRLLCLFFLLATCVLSVLLWRGAGRGGEGMVEGRRQQTLLTCALALVVATSVADGFFATNNRQACDVTTFPGTRASTSTLADDTAQALAWLRETDPSWYRVEKLYEDQVGLNDALMERYEGISAYNSTIDHDLVDFYRTLWPEAVPVGTFYQQFRADPAEPQLLGTLGVRYLLATDELSWEWASQVATFGQVRVYRCTAAESPLTARGTALSESEAAELGDPQALRSLLSYVMIVPDDIAHTWEASSATEPSSDPTVVAKLGRTEAIITGTISCDTNALACLALPHTDGWTVTLDGTPVTTWRANYGFIGFALPAGDHVLKARFVPAGLRLGALVTLAGLVLTVIVARLSGLGPRLEASRPEETA